MLLDVTRTDLCASGRAWLFAHNVFSDVRSKKCWVMVQVWFRATGAVGAYHTEEQNFPIDDKLDADGRPPLLTPGDALDKNIAHLRHVTRPESITTAREAHCDGEECLEYQPNRIPCLLAPPYLHRDETNTS